MRGSACWFCALLLTALLGGCRRGPEIVYLTSFDGVPPAELTVVRRAIEQFCGRPVRLLPPQHHRVATRCPVRHRQRAGLVLPQLSQLLPDSTDGKILALTTQDVEIEEPPRRPHWGVMGLARRTEAAGVVSTFRLGGRRDRLRKVSLHEIGHLLSLPHCQSGTVRCLMQDARGRAATVDRTAELLCAACRARLAW